MVNSPKRVLLRYRLQHISNLEVESTIKKYKLNCFNVCVVFTGCVAAAKRNTLSSTEPYIALNSLGTTIFVLVRFIIRSNHCYWERTVCFKHQDSQMFGLKSNTYE